jgi:hypothetical protein
MWLREALYLDGFIRCCRRFLEEKHPEEL